MTLHRLAPPIPPNPLFTRSIPATMSPRKGNIGLFFYTPASYANRDRTGNRYPVLVNFHGGGFTLGRATDDARWAQAVVDEVNAVVVSVDYRLAPEHPFPTAVEDGVDAVLYLVGHAEELGIDANRIAMSGFSAGGNMAFTTSLRLKEEILRRRAQGHMDLAGLEWNVIAIVAWYPSTDFTNPRAARRLTNIRPDKELPKLFTDLFDASYLYPPHSVSMSDPYLSPGVAPTEMLKSLPDDICIYTCEWDELLAEAERFRDRLERECGKRVKYKMFQGTAHAWDKSPTPGLGDPKRDAAYQEACHELRRVFSNT